MATDIATLGIKIEAGDIKQAVRELDRLERQGKDTEKTTKKLTGAFKGFAGVVAALAGGAAVAGLVDTNRQFEKLKISLKTVTGSAEEATKAFNLIEDFAKNAPFSVAELTQSFIKMRALGLEPTAATMKSFANTASAMGKSFDQFTEAVADAVTGEFERLKEFGIKAKSEGDKVSFTFQNVTTKIGKNSKEIKKYLTSIGDVQFAGAAVEQMEGLDGALSNLADSFDQLQVAIGDAGLNQVFKDLATDAAAFTDVLTEQVKAIGETGGLSEFIKLRAALFKLAAESDDLDISTVLMASPEESIALYKLFGEQIEGVGRAFDGLPDEPPVMLDPVVVKASTSAIEDNKNAANELGEEWDIALDLIEAQFHEVDEEHAKMIAGIESGAEDAASAWDRMAEEMKDSISDSLTDSIVNFKSFGDVVSNVGNSIARSMIKQNISDPLAKEASSFFSGLDFGDMSFAGGGFTGRGARSGGVDGKGGFPAILHPNETVVDHTKGQQTGAVTVNLTLQNTAQSFDPRSAAQLLTQQAGTIGKIAVASINQALNKNGRTFS